MSIRKKVSSFLLLRKNKVDCEKKIKDKGNNNTFDQKKDVESGPTPVDLRKKTLVSFVTPVLYDTPIWGKNFGDCIKQPQKLARPGDIVTAVFVSILIN